MKWTHILCGVSFPLYIFINVTDLCTFIYCVLASELNKNNEIVTRERTYQSTTVSSKSWNHLILCGGHLTQTYCNQSIKKSLKIPKGYSETVNRRMTHKAMAKRTNNNLQNIAHKTKDGVTRTPLNTGSELMYFWL